MTLQNILSACLRFVCGIVLIVLSYLAYEQITTSVIPGKPVLVLGVSVGATPGITFAIGAMALIGVLLIGYGFVTLGAHRDEAQALTRGGPIDRRLSTMRTLLPGARESFRYWAFISYSNEDAQVAERLHRKLERYRIPRHLRGRIGRDGPIPTRLTPVFRDRDELAAASDVGAAIKDALRESRYLVVVCSPSAAKSRWVNDEVRYFKLLGRQDRIFTLIVAGDPSSAGQADGCFCPALRHDVEEDGRARTEFIEPLAGDLRRSRDGWHRAFLKVVAGITGLGVDAFVGRGFNRWREVSLRLGKIVACFGLGIFLLWCMLGFPRALRDSRVTASDFAELGSVLSVPVGIGELSDAFRAGRRFHYHVESRGNQVQRVVHVNSVGTPIDEEETGAAIREIAYGPDGTLKGIDYMSQAGRRVKRELYGDLSILNGDRVQDVRVVSWDESALMMSKTSVAGWNPGLSSPWARDPRITDYRVVYDSGGRTTMLLFLDATGRPCAEDREVFGKRYVYLGAALLPSQIQNLSSSGATIADRAGIVAVRIERVTGVGPSSWSCLGQGGVRIDGADEIHRRACAYDKHGNCVREAYFGLQGATKSQDFGRQGAAKSRDGYHAIARSYDNGGNLIEVAYFDTSGRPIANNDGFHRATFVYDERGIRMEQAYFDALGKPTAGRRGFHIIKTRTDSRGRLVREACYGIDGKPVLNVDKYHSRETAYDDVGNAKEETYFGTDGRPVENAEGFVLLHEYRIPGGQLVREGQSARHDKTRRRYSPAGSLESEEFLTAEGKARPDKNSAVRYVYTSWSEDGSPTAGTAFAADGTKTPWRRDAGPIAPAVH